MFTTFNILFKVKLFKFESSQEIQLLSFIIWKMNKEHWFDSNLLTFVYI